MRERYVGTVSRGIRAPVIRAGDDIVSIVVDSVVQAAEGEDFVLRNRDIVAITEAVIARAQDNYATLDEMAADLARHFDLTRPLGIVFPILSRNRFAVNLRAFARACSKIVLQLSYPADEVGNSLLNKEQLEASKINPYSDLLTEAEFRELFGLQPHIFTGIDYIEYYREIIQEEDCEVEIILANDPTRILAYTDQVLHCDIHTRLATGKKLRSAGAATVVGMHELMREPVNGSGYNPEFGLLGSNKATEESVKLFPRDCYPAVRQIQTALFERTGKHIEVMIYGDGAFRDPVGQIWELADPVVSPAYTEGLEGTPSELKLKYLADNQFGDLEGAELQTAIKGFIAAEHEAHCSTQPTTADATADVVTPAVIDNIREGTTPRRIPDLLGSLADLTSGSGDKGTPIVLIQGYFDNFGDGYED